MNAIANTQPAVIILPTETKSVAKRKAAQRKARPRTPAKERAIRISFAQRFAVLKMIAGASESETDAELADKASAILPRAIATGTITIWRRKLGLTPVKEPTKAQLRERLAAAERELAALKQPDLLEHGPV